MKNTTVLYFKACKYLDFVTDYTAIKQVLSGDVDKVFWLRNVSYDPLLPAMVQFCSKRGRLNSATACLSYTDKRCGDYEEFEHEVKITE